VKDDEIEDLYMSEWLQFAIVLLITLVSVAAFAFLLGYLL
tara:strand:+ start:20 stop:139 length:120 start_codon:yes stop_codon:yes gene_type:complete